MQQSRKIYIYQIIWKVILHDFPYFSGIYYGYNTVVVGENGYCNELKIKVQGEKIKKGGKGIKGNLH